MSSATHTLFRLSLAVVTLGAAACGEPWDDLAPSEQATVTEVKSELVTTSFSARGASFRDPVGPPGDLAIASAASPMVPILFDASVTGSKFLNLNQRCPSTFSAPQLGFPTAMEWGDFNGDGRDELIIGIELLKKKTETVATGGFMIVRFGSSGLVSSSDCIQIADGATNPATELRWGRSLATGDFDGDGYDDLAVGSGVNRALIYKGAATGLATAPFWSDYDTSGAFTMAMEAGDFNCDGYEDLAISNPSIGSPKDGRVYLYNGSASGPAYVNYLRQEGGLSGDHFGDALAAGNFNGDKVGTRPCIDLAVGIPYRQIGTAQAAGQVNVYHSQGAAGLTRTSYKVIHQDVSGVLDTAESGDLFGFRLTVSDVNGDGKDDLAAMIFLEYGGGDCGGDAGVQIFAGGTSGIQPSVDAIYRSMGHNGNLGSTEKNKIAVAAFQYSPDACPDTHVRLYTFNNSASTTLSLSSLGFIHAADWGFTPSYGFGDGLTHSRPGFIR